jgi:hypothetical protein
VCVDAQATALVVFVLASSSDSGSDRRRRLRSRRPWCTAADEPWHGGSRSTGCRPDVRWDIQPGAQP